MATQTADPALPAADPGSRRIEDLLNVVRSLYAELHREPAGVDTVGLDSKLERDLGFDSLARVELLHRIEQGLGVRLPDATLGAVESVEDLLRAVASVSTAESARTRSPGSGPTAPSPITARPSAGVPDHAATLDQVLEWRAQTNPDATHAVVLNDGQRDTLSFAQLQEGASAVAAGLVNTGVQPGSTVALMLPTSTGYLRAFLGVILAGAIPVPIYPPTRPSQIAEHVHRHKGILMNAQADTLITFQEARTVARLLRSQVPTLRNVLSIGELSQESPVWPRQRASSAGSIAMLQYTSGSTGAPKGVVLTHENLLANIRAMGKVIRAGNSDVFVSWLPLYHDMGLIGAWLGSLYFGCLFVAMPPTAFLRQPARWLRAVHEYGATLSASPNFGYALCARRLTDEDLEGLNLSSWRIAFNGAEPVIPDTLDRFCERLAPFGFRREAMTPVYGLAEAAVGLTFPPIGRGPISDCVDRGEMMRAGRAEPVPADRADCLRFVSCGKPLPGYEVRVVDASGSEAPERIEGTVQFNGPSATAGYYRNSSATRQLVHGGWLDTGDRGYMASGELFITGRVKDIIIRRGRHIYPDEIERAVGELEGIRKGGVAAFGTHERTTATERLVVLAETLYTDPTLLNDLKSRINECVVASVGEPPEEIVLSPPHTVLKTSSGKIRRAATCAAYEDGSLGRAPASPAIQMARLALESVVPALRRRKHAASIIAYGWFAWIAILLFALVVGSLSLLWSDRSRIWRLNHRAARRLVSVLRIPFSVTRESAVDLPEPHIIVSNHCSYVDSILLGAILPGVHLFVAKAELQSAPLLRAWLRKLGTLFIERFEAVHSVENVDLLRRELERGNSIVVFPEGTFTRATGLRPFHLGAFQAAAAAGAPIIPVTLRGTRSVLRDGQRLLRRMPVSVTVGPPLAAPAGVNVFETAVRLRDQAREHILARCGEPDLT